MIKWELHNSCGRMTLVTILRNFGFKASADEEKTYVRNVDDFHPLKAVFTDKGLDIIIHYAGAVTYQRYFDYMFECGVIVGQIMMCLDKATLDFVPFEDEAEEYDDDPEQEEDDEAGEPE